MYATNNIQVHKMALLLKNTYIEHKLPDHYKKLTILEQ